MPAELLVTLPATPGRKQTPLEAFKLQTAAEKGARRALTHLRQRQQDVRVETETVLSYPINNFGAFTKLITDAIREVASLTSRRSTLVVSINDNHILIKGNNALDLPDSDLAIDRKIVAQASRLGIVPRLIWNQGSGPHFRCALPQLGAEQA